MWRRGLQTAGLMLAILSLVSFWVAENPTNYRAEARPNLTTSSGQVASFNVLIAGRDINYCKPGFGPGGLKAVPCEGAERYQGRTDTMMFIHVSPERMDVLSIPRDTQVSDRYGTHKINSTFAFGGDESLAQAGITIKDPGAGEVYATGGAEALKTTLESLMGVNIDYYGIFNVELVQKVIDALGGVDVYLPEAMKYDDIAADLHIDLPAGNQHLDGKTAIGYLRFRHGYGSDYARMDRGKAVIGKLLEKVKSPAVLGAVPTLIAGLSNDVTTNADLELVRTVLPQLRGIRPNFGTLPTVEDTRYGSNLLPDQAAIARLMAPLLGTETQDPNPLDTPTEAVTVVDQSGVPGLGRAFAAYLKRSGMPEAQVVELEVADVPTQVLYRPWADRVSVDQYASFLGVQIFAPYRYPEGANQIAIQLGREAATQYAALALEATNRGQP
jgi:polyisoprenyl-teichoic acid--peptidoglycan teichoic acid transferase